MEYICLHLYITLVHLQWIYFVQIKDWECKEANVFEGVHNIHLSGEAFKIANTTQYQVLVWQLV